MWFIYVAILILLFIYLLDDFLLDKRQFELYKKFPSPPRLPLIGHAYIALFVKPKDFVDLLKRIRKRFPTSTIAGYIGNNLEVGISDYKYIEKILTDNRFISKSSLYSFLGDILGDGLLFSTNQKWFNRRRVITPTFHFKILEQFFDIFQKQSESLVEKLKEKCDESAIDILPLINSCVLKSLCETAMGYEMQDQDSDNIYLKAVRELNYHVANSFLSPWHRIKFIYNLTPTKRAKDKCANVMRKFTTKIIEERRKFLAQIDKNSLELLDDVGLKKKMCLLDVLLLSTVENKPLSNSEIQEEVDTFTFAGHDTTTNAISFTLYMIAKHFEVQKKLNDEIDEILPRGEKLNFKILGKFKYLDMVIKETLRLYPPVPIISRRLFEEVQVGDFVAPANANFNLALYEIFRNEKDFENPENFVPERFLSNIPPFAFIPFSAGIRNCIGQKFAMIKIKTSVINILRNFELIDCKIKPKVELHITMKCNKLFIGLKRK